MKFVKTTPKNVVQPIANKLLEALQSHNRVLWLVPGGSNIPLVVQVMDKIPDNVRHHLAILLTDERFGEAEHEDSNMRQLAEAGLQAGNATVVPVLVPGLSFEQTIERYNQAIKDVLDKADYTFGYFGMGADGHIAGVLPGTPGVSSKKYVVGYDAGTFTRITMTLQAIKRIDAAVLVAFGDSKTAMLSQLKTKKTALTKQPSQVLKSIKDVTVYNDSVGDK